MGLKYFPSNSLLRLMAACGIMVTDHKNVHTGCQTLNQGTPGKVADTVSDRPLVAVHSGLKRLFQALFL